jgi:hypothetical protein
MFERNVNATTGWNEQQEEETRLRTKNPPYKTLHQTQIHARAQVQVKSRMMNQKINRIRKKRE